MPTIRVPKKAMTRFDLPAVCLATGKSEGVEYHKTTFQFIPMWARLSVVFCGLIGVILMLVATKRVEAEIPMTAEAFAAWSRAKKILIALILVAVAIMIVPMLIDPELIVVGIGAGFLLLIGAIVYSVVALKNSGPVCKEIDEETITLDVPSPEAASAIEARLGLGGSGAAAVTAPAT